MYYPFSMVKLIISLNVLVFALSRLNLGFNWFRVFGLVPRAVLSGLAIWQPVTYMFLHAGLWHLALNMLMLWFFAREIEAAWGKKQFLFYYFFSGIGAGLCSFILSWHSAVPVVGASGVIFAMLVAYAFMFPERVLLLFFIFPMPVKYAVLVLAGINLLGAVSSPGGDISYIAHLGGGIFGYLYLKSEVILRNISRMNMPFLNKSSSSKPANKQSLDAEVDLILDKISQKGLESLTAAERRILDQKSRQG